MTIVPEVGLPEKWFELTAAVRHLPDEHLQSFQADFSLLLGASFTHPDHAAALGTGRLFIEDKFDYLAALETETSGQAESFFRGVEDEAGGASSETNKMDSARSKEPSAILTTDRLILRRWRDSDRHPFARMNADSRVMEFIATSLSRKDSDSMVDKIEAHFEEHGFGLCAAELRQGGAFIGFIGMSVPDFKAPYSVELGWRLAAEYWGSGLATEGARAVVHYAFQTLGLDEIVATTFFANARSRRVMEKLGMRHNPGDDFDHPLLPDGHPLRRHVLYRLRLSAWM